MKNEEPFTPRVFWGDNGTLRLGWWLDLRPIGKKVEPIWGPAIHDSEATIRHEMNTGRNFGLWNGPISFEPAICDCEQCDRKVLKNVKYI